LPLVFIAPLLGLFMNMEPVAIAAVVATLAVGTPALTLIGAIGAALTVTLRRGGLLLPILVLPMCVPVLIFGVSATTAAVMEPAPFMTPFLILSALALFSAVLGPIAAGAALRQAMD
jgi:heme exporter protein B